MSMSEKTGAQLLSSADRSLPRPLQANYKTYRTMRRDPTIALARMLVIAPVLASQWSFKSTDSAPEGAVDFIKEQFEPIRLHILRSASLGCIDYGHQGYEKVFEVAEDMKLRLKKLKPLLQGMTDIRVDPDTGAYDGLAQTGVELSVDESLLISIDVEGTDWAGEPLMENARLAFNEWNTANEGANRYDRKIAGAHWIIHFPPGTSDYNGTETDNLEIAKDFIRVLQSSGALAVPQTVSSIVDDLNASAPNAWKIELLSAAGQGQPAFVARQQYLDALKVRAFGLPERSLLEGQFGTKAEAEAHAEIAITNMDVRHKVIVQHVNWHVINQLLRYNWGKKFENTVFIEPAPITDLALMFLRQIYQSIISNPDGFTQVLGSIDLEQLSDRLAVPVKAEEPVDVPTIDNPASVTGLEQYLPGAMQDAAAISTG